MYDTIKTCKTFDRADEIGNLLDAAGVPTRVAEWAPDGEKVWEVQVDTSHWTAAQALLGEVLDTKD